MDYSQLEGFRDAVKTFQANVSPRYRHLENLDAWMHGRQYDGLTDWFSEEKPLWERAPCIVYLLAKESVESKVDLVLGEGRFPQITTSPGEDDPFADQKATKSDQEGADQDDSKLLDALIERAMRQSSFRAVAREVLHHGQEVGSAVVIFGVRKGKLFCDTTKAQWCEPEIDPDGEVLKLTIQYPYLDPYKDQQGKWKVRVRIYRRVITATDDTTYYPAEANQDGRDVTDWRPNPQLKFQHGFGFCPVVWYPFMRGCGTANQVDGKAVHELLLDEIRGLDFGISQRHRAALYAGDPQWTECGVTAGYNPSGPARTAVVPATPKGGMPGPGNPVTGGYVDTSGATQPARKKTPGGVWQYPDVNTKVTLHALPGDAFKATSDHAADLRMKLCEMLAFVPLDPDSISHIRQLSGKALEALRKRELNRCDKIRDDVGDRFISPAIQMLVRICALFAKRGGLNLAGLTKVAPILLTIVGDISLRLVWGDYDDPDPEEEQQIVATSVAALQGGIATERMALEKVQPVFRFENVDQALDALQKEKAERQAQQIELAQATKPQPGAAAGKSNGAPKPQPSPEA